MISIHFVKNKYWKKQLKRKLPELKKKLKLLEKMNKHLRKEKISISVILVYE